LLSWQVPTNNGGSTVTNYSIFEGLVPNHETLLKTIENITTYNDTGLTNGQTYCFTVDAINAAGSGENATGVNATPFTVPGAPLSLEAISGNGCIELSWSAPTSNGGATITNYSIFEGTTPSNEIHVKTIGNVTIFNDTGLANGYQCYFTVAAMNVAGTGANATGASATPATSPTAPQSLQATPGDTIILLSWIPPASNGGSAITGYKIYLGNAPGSVSLYVTEGNATNFTAVDLVNNQTYYFEISAVNGVGEGALSIEISATPVSSTAGGGGKSGGNGGPNPSGLSIPGFPTEITCFVLVIACAGLAIEEKRRYNSQIVPFA
jgi:titin